MTEHEGRRTGLRYWIGSLSGRGDHRDADGPQEVRSRRRWPRRLGWAALVVLLLGLVYWLGSGSKQERAAPASAEQGTIWTCSMHPQIQLPEPGQCPICGMDLIPLEPIAAEEPGAEIRLSERARTLARIRTEPVRRGSAAIEVRLLGRLEADETRVRTVTPWLGGRIDRLYVSVEGARIRRGQPIAELYSPEAYSAQQDLITARRQLDAMKNALPAARATAAAAFEAAQKRLDLLGIPAETIDEMAEERAPRERVTVYAGYGGTVLEQMVNQGAYVSAGTPLFRVADLEQLWVQMDAYESELGLLSVGQKVTLAVASYPGESFTGRVSFIDPVVNPETRTAQVRVEVPNDDGRLSPGMFAEAVVHAPKGVTPEPPLVIPRTAPLFTGRRSLVYVELEGRDQPAYEAREVRLGPRTGDVYPVVSGLEEGERIVTQGAFAIDAELQIRGGQSMMAKQGEQGQGALGPIDVPEAFLSGLAPIVRAYLELQKHLASDDLKRAQAAAATVAQKATSFEPVTPREGREAWATLKKPMVLHAAQLAKAGSIERARQAFEPLSARVIELLRRFGNPLETRVNVAFCPMVAHGRGALWLQLADDIQNPYYGARMFRCGEIRDRLETGERPRLDGQPAQAAPAGGHQH